MEETRDVLETRHLQYPDKIIYIYGAVIRSKLIYGLDSIQINISQRKELVAFQLKGIRQIFKILTTYVDREDTNEIVFKRATEWAGKEIKPINIYIQERANKLMGHLIRAGQQDPMKFNLQ